MDFAQQFDAKNLLKKENKIINIFVSELQLFQNKLNTYINSIKTQIIKEIKLRQELLNKILQKEFTYIDIQNAKAILDEESFKIINDYIDKFCNSKSFVEKYDYIKNILKEGIQQGKYLENLNISNIIKKLGMHIIPLKEKYFIKIIRETEKISTTLQIIKDNSDKYLKELKYNILSEKSFGCQFSQFILKNNINFEKELLLYAIQYRKAYQGINENLFEVKILNILDKNKIKYEIKQLFFNEKMFNFGLISLDINKNIIFKGKYICMMIYLIKLKY